MVRPASASKPEIEALHASGVDIRLGDLSDGVEKLAQLLEGVDIVISAVDAQAIKQQ